MRKWTLPVVPKRETLLQAWRLCWIRWLILVFSTLLLVVEAWLGAPTELTRIMAGLILLAALFNLAFQPVYRWALDGRFPQGGATALAYVHTVTDLAILFGVLHYTGGINSPMDLLLMVYLVGVAILYPWQAVLGFTLLSLLGYGFLAWGYVTGRLPVYLQDGRVSPPPGLRFVILWASADILFLSLVVGMTFVMATALRLARMRAEQERAYLDQLHRLLQESLRQGELRTLAQYLADHMGALVGANGVFLTLWDPERELPIPLAAYGEKREEYPHIEVTPEDRPNLTESVYRLGHPLVIPDILNTPYLKPEIAAQFPTRSAIVVPMYAHPTQEFLGAAIFSYHSPRDLTQEEIQRAQEITNAMSVVLSRAIASARLRKQTALLEALLYLSLEMERLHEPSRLAQIALDGICSLLNTHRGACYVLDEKQAGLVVLAARGLSEEYLQWVQQTYPNLPGAQALEFGSVFLVADVEQDPRIPEALRQKAREEGFRAYMLASMTVPHGPQGGLALYWDRPRHFQYEEELAVRLLASHLGVALGNVRLVGYLETMARTDPLTGLPNRRAFREALEREWLRAQRYRRPLGLFLLDLDDFKRINDEHGHLVGDQVLRQVASALRGAIRDTDFIARYGGDEFVVLLPETEPVQGARMAQRLIRAVEHLRFVGVPEGVKCSLSVGMAFYPRDADSPDALMAVADQRLYQAKRARKTAPPPDRQDAAA